MSVKTKWAKCLIKTLMLLPVGFLYSIIFMVLDVISFSSSLVISLVFALLMMFWNVFDYEKYNDITIIDFLESKHKIVLEQSNVDWNDLKECIEVSVNFIQFIKETDKMMQFQIKRRYLNSILSVRNKNGNFEIEIKSTPLSFIPDNAKNYNTLKRIQFELNKEQGKV